MHRIPFMNQTSIQKMINGPESFTPDTHYIIGEAPQLKNYFVAAGFNSSGTKKKKKTSFKYPAFSLTTNSSQLSP